MTSHQASIDVREVVFINTDARKGYDGLPQAVAETVDSAITALQNGGTPSAAGLWRGLSGKLRGIGEIRINDGTDTYRIYVWLGCDPVVFVLDAGIKKSPTGGEIPRWQQDRLVDRRGRAAQVCAANQDMLRQRFVQRAERREQRERRR